MDKVNSPKKPIIWYYIIVLVVLMLINAFVVPSIYERQIKNVDYGTFIKMTESGDVGQADIKQNENYILFTDKSGKTIYKTGMVNDPELNDRLYDNGVSYYGEIIETASPIVTFLFSWIFPIILFVVLGQILSKQIMKKAGGKNSLMFGGGNSGAKIYVPSSEGIKFSDVAGEDEAKENLSEIVNYLHDPTKYKEIGASMPKGILLVGPPGTGKTMLAKAVAGEANVPFFSISGSEFVEMFVGMGAARVRDLFEQGRKNAPCIIFIDELDAVGRARGSGLGGGHDEREQTLNQMLVEMDGFSSDPGVIVIAATNRPDVLDPALLRPGRFDRQVTVALPDVQERLDILRIHTKKVHILPDVDLSRIARATPGSSGADLANLVNEAALFAARNNRTEVSMDDFENARDKILLGVARESVFMTAEEKKATAYHEAGHTLLHYYLKHVDPLHKVTIIPHGRALGLTLSLPEKDSYTLTKSYIEDRIKICMGGYAAEQIVYGETTTGTSNDIKQATELAHRMVTEFGMSELGFISLGSDDEPLFLGREIAQHKDYSEETARKIDQQMHEILDNAMRETMEILTTHRDQLDKLTQALVEKETLEDSEIRAMFGFPEVEHLTDLK